MPSAPAMGAATTEMPGRNLAAISELPPHFDRMPSLWRTQVSGDSEMRHRSFITRWPRQRPAWYQTASPSTLATTEASRHTASETWPAMATPPATTSSGAAGTGAPTRAASVMRNTMRAPWATRSGMSSRMRAEGYPGLRNTFAAGPSPGVSMRRQSRDVRREPDRDPAVVHRAVRRARPHPPQRHPPGHHRALRVLRGAGQHAGGARADAAMAAQHPRSRRARAPACGPPGPRRAGAAAGRGVDHQATGRTARVGSAEVEAGLKRGPEKENARCPSLEAGTSSDIVTQGRDDGFL